jgi:hypothetical protein
LKQADGGAWQNHVHPVSFLTDLKQRLVNLPGFAQRSRRLAGSRDVFGDGYRRLYGTDCGCGHVAFSSDQNSTRETRLFEVNEIHEMYESAPIVDLSY